MDCPALDSTHSLTSLSLLEQTTSPGVSGSQALNIKKFIFKKFHKSCKMARWRTKKIKFRILKNNFKLILNFSTVNPIYMNTQQERTKCRLEIYFKLYDSGYASSLVCTKRKLLRCSQLQRVEYDLLKYIHANIIVASHKFFDNFLRNCFLFLIQGKFIALNICRKAINILNSFFRGI